MKSLPVFFVAKPLTIFVEGACILYVEVKGGEATYYLCKSGMDFIEPENEFGMM